MIEIVWENGEANGSDGWMGGERRCMGIGEMISFSAHSGFLCAISIIQ